MLIIRNVMNKYRVLKSYPKRISNSGRLVTLSPNSIVTLKQEAQVIRLVKLGFIKPVSGLPDKKRKDKVEPAKASSETKSASKSDYLNKKKNKDVTDENKS